MMATKEAVSYWSFMSKFKPEKIITKLLLFETLKSYKEKIENHRKFLELYVVEKEINSTDLEDINTYPLVIAKGIPSESYYYDLELFFERKHIFLSQRYLFKDLNYLKDFLIDLHKKWRVFMSCWLIEKEFDLSTEKETYILTPLWLRYPLYFWNKKRLLNHLDRGIFWDFGRF